MEVMRPRDVDAFLSLAGPLLARDEARNNLILGIAGTLAAHPDAHEEARLWVALERGEPMAAALRTPPHDLVLGDPASDPAMDTLLEAILRDDDELPGIVGNDPAVHGAADRLASSTGRVAEVVLEQGVYALTAVRPLRRPPGTARPTGPTDRELLRRWLDAFLREAVPEPDVHLEQIDRSLETRYVPPDGGMWLWEDDGEPVSLSGFGGPTPTGIRIGPVYTPPERRRRGYATALVADLSAQLLAQGHRACFLYTDLSNPTSNRIYEDVGYQRVADAVQYRFSGA